MGTWGPSVSKRRVRAWLGHALLFAFVVRALVPVGFMPDLAAARDGTFKIVICTSNGLAVLGVDENGNPTDVSPNNGPITKHTGDPCVFSGMTPFALGADVAALTVPLAYAAPAVSPRSGFALPPVRAGPALGSRAPPVLS